MIFCTCPSQTLCPLPSLQFAPRPALGYWRGILSTHSNTTEFDIRDLPLGQRERNKKKNNGHNAPSSACLTTNLCLFLEAEHYINAWERLFQLAWETAGFWCCSRAAAPVLRSEGQRQWLSVPSDALWALGTLWPREETQSWPKPPPGTMI